MLEKMDVFFENRLIGYDEHMLTTIEGADEFYTYTPLTQGKVRSEIRFSRQYSFMPLIFTIWDFKPKVLPFNPAPLLSQRRIMPAY